MQSCSKPFTYAVCLNELGSEEVHQYVGQVRFIKNIKSKKYIFHSSTHILCYRENICRWHMSTGYPQKKCTLVFCFLSYSKNILTCQFLQIELNCSNQILWELQMTYVYRVSTKEVYSCILFPVICMWLQSKINLSYVFFNFFGYILRTF